MPWLACHNSEIDWRMGEVKMTRCLEEYGEAVETKAGKIGVAKTKGRGSKERSQEEMGRKRKQKRRKENKRKKER